MAPDSTIRPTSTASRASYNDRMTLNETALFATQLAMGFALAATVGLRAFLPLFVAGLLARHGSVDLRAAVAGVQGPPALGGVGRAGVVGIPPDKGPARDPALHAARGDAKPILSLVEDGLAGVGILAAVLIPVFAALSVLALVGLGAWLYRRRRTRSDVLPREASYPR